MPIFCMAFPVSIDVVKAIQRLNKCSDYNIEVMVEGPGTNIEMTAALREILMSAIISLDEEVNGTRN